MKTINDAVKVAYGNQLRVRVCGICIRDHKILLVNHAMHGPGTSFWGPPGGGVEFGETVEQALTREFDEEVGLGIKVGGLLFVQEFIQSPLHALELFFQVEAFSGDLKIGEDPEFSQEDQLIKEVRWIGLGELQSLPDSSKHSILIGLKDLDELLNIRGLLQSNILNN